MPVTIVTIVNPKNGTYGWFGFPLRGRDKSLGRYADLINRHKAWRPADSRHF